MKLAARGQLGRTADEGMQLGEVLQLLELYTVCSQILIIKY